MRSKILHIITSLHADGAQNMLLKLAQERNQENFDYEVVSLLDKGVLGPELEKSGVKIHSLKMKSLHGLLTSIPKLRSIIKNYKPDVIQAWMYHANLLSLAIVKTISSAERPKLVWNIRRDLDSFAHDKFFTKITIKLNSLFSKLPTKIIYCGSKVKKDHLAIGFTDCNSELIANGFNCEKFFPTADRRKKLRHEINIPNDSNLIGMVGRFHSQKNHKNFVQMADKVLDVLPSTHFVLIGQGCNSENSQLIEWIGKTKKPVQFHLLGARRDIPEILPSLDVFCLSSSAEGFPNVLGEAMASGVISVSTDAGASREIIGDDQRIAPIDNSNVLAEKVLEVLRLSPLEREKIQALSRTKILENFQISSISNKYQDLYESIRR